jgi:putative hemolysin
MESLLILLAVVFLLLLQGFFSGSEIALVHADRLKLHHLANKGHRGASRILRFFKKPEVLLGTTLVGTNISVVASTTLGTVLMIRTFGEHGDLIAFLVFTPLLLLFGEVIPKSVYQQKADELSLVIIHPLRLFLWVFYPVVFIFSWVARSAARLAGIQMTSSELFVNREQIRTVVEMAESGTNIDVFDRDRVMRVMRYAETTVGNVMVPLAEMTTIDAEKTTRDAIRLARKHGHFRLPVFEQEHNRITGIVSFTLWDLMDHELVNKPFTEMVQPACFVTPLQLLDELLPVLQHRLDHMAVVVDEYGSAIGMITLEDILNEVVGEVVNVGYTFDQHLSRKKYRIEKLGEDSYLMDGRVSVIDAAAAMDISLPTSDMHTIGGLLTSHLHHLPEAGESIVLAGYRFDVEEVDERSVRKVRVTLAG